MQEVGTAGRPSGEAAPRGGAKMPQKHLICFERTLFKNAGVGVGGGVFKWMISSLVVVLASCCKPMGGGGSIYRTCTALAI